MVIDLNAILVEKTFSNTGEDLSLKVFEDLDSKIKDLLYYSVQRMEIEAGDGNWDEIFNTNYIGHYRIAYLISIKPAYQSNVTLLFSGQEATLVSTYYEFYIV
jgi:hypothetical protein